MADLGTRSIRGFGPLTGQKSLYTHQGLTALDEWFNCAPSVEMAEHVVGLGSYGRTLTILAATRTLDCDEINEEFNEDEDEEGGVPSATGRFPIHSRRR